MKARVTGAKRHRIIEATPTRRRGAGHEARDPGLRGRVERERGEKMDMFMFCSYDEAGQ